MRESDDKVAEDALRESEERYRSFISQVTDGVYRFELTDPMPVDMPVEEQIDFIYDHTRLAECNPAFLDMYQIDDPADLIGKSLLALHGSRDNPVNRESQRQFLVSGFKTENKLTEEIDAAGNRKYFNNNVLGIIEHGHLVRLWGTQTDITERKRAEDALRENEHRLRIALETASMVTWDWDIPAGTIRYSANVFDLTHGIAIEPFCSIDGLIQTIHPDDRTAVTKAIRQTVGEGVRFECEYRVKMLDGAYHWVSDRGDVVERREGRPLRALGISQDVTARKMAEEALKQRSRQLSDLTAQVTLIEHRERRRLADHLHDRLQQVLVGARMQVHALASTAPLKMGKELRRISEILAEAGEAARSISRDIAPPVAVHGHLPDAFRWLVIEVRRRHQFAVRARIKGDLAQVPEAESIFLFTAARELLLNIIKHADVRQAELELSRRVHAVVLKIRDRGCGFDPGSMTSRESGGFGLFSIRERVELLGGRFSLVSRPGHGVLVTVSVPMSSVPPPPRPRGKKFGKSLAFAP